MGIEYNASMYMEFKILKFYLMTFQITTDSSENVRFQMLSNTTCA